MAQVESGRTLSISAAKIYKGTAEDSGILLKLHENSFTTGYSALVPLTGTTGVAFGSGVWYTDAKGASNKVEPKRTSTNPFAGILVRQNYIAEGIPNENNETAAWNKGLLVKEGYLVYKTGATFSDVTVGMKLLIDVTDGSASFATDATAVGAYKSTTHYCAGVVVQINPDDSSWTVKVSAF